MQRSIGTKWTMLAIAGLLAGCSIASVPSEAPVSATPLAPTSAPAVTPTSPVTSSPTQAGPTGGGLVIVLQLDGSSFEDAETQTVFTLDVGTGERREIATIEVNEETCCPSEVSVSADRNRAFLYGGQYIGTVELKTGEVALRPRDLQGYRILNSNRGDRLAWLDEFAGAWESLVLVGLDGNQIGKVELPETAWQTEFVWAPDDSAFAITTVLTIPGLKFPVTPEPAAAAVCCASGPGLVAAANLACCTPDHGVTASHLMVVPGDGGQTRSLVDTEDLVRRDLEVPNPTWPPDMTGNATLEPERGLSSPTWAADGGSILYIHTTCEVTFGRGLMGNCSHQLRVVDVATANDRLVTESPTPIWGLTWSPGGDRIGYLTHAGEDPRGEDSGLWLVDAAGGEPVLLSDAIGNVHWSPDGSWISFERLSTTRTEGDRADLWAMPLDGGEPQLIAEHAAGGW